jgi:Bifunctional DNA primase/polymerase, N-terminal
MVNTSTNGKPLSDVRDAAATYLVYQLAPIPLPRGSKAPDRDGWTQWRITPETIDTFFPRGVPLNIGILTGTPSDRLVDVDLDTPEAIAAADFLLPETGWIFGRASSPRSHRLYRPTGALPKSQKYRDPAGKRDRDTDCIVELRADALQTRVPPSTHVNEDKTVEVVEWDRFDAPGELLAEDLEAAVAEVAAAALLARSWPAEGSRQDAALALSGGLARGGRAAERIKRFILAVANATGDEEARMRGQTAERTAAKVAAGQSTTGWPRLAELVGDRVITSVCQWLGMQNRVAPEVADLPLPVDPPWPGPPGQEAFYGLAGDIVRVIEPSSEASPVALLVQTLVAFGSVIGRTAHFIVESDRHFCNESVVLVGRTSKARKGTSWGRVRRLFQEVEEQWATDRIQSGLSSGEGLVWAIRDPIQKRERLKENGETRYEDVEADPGISDKRLLVYEPEFANVLKQTERQGNNLSAILRQAWDGLDLRTLAKNNPARATAPHVSVIGHITADELRRYLTQTEAANGFANRHFFVATARSRLLPEGGSLDAVAWDGLRSELTEAIAFARSVGEMTRDEEARALWREVYEDLSEGKPGLAGALLARGEAHTLRLAMLYALMDRSSVITAVHLLAALAFWDYAERSVYFIFGDDTGDPVADDLMRLLRGSPDGLTRTDIMHYFGRHQTSDRIGRALGLLLRYRMVRRDEQKTKGRTAERWFATSKPT